MSESSSGLDICQLAESITDRAMSLLPQLAMDDGMESGLHKLRRHAGTKHKVWNRSGIGREVDQCLETGGDFGRIRSSRPHDTQVIIESGESES